MDRESLLPIKAFPPSTSSFEASPVLELARSAMNSFSCSVTAIGKWIKHKKVRWEIGEIDRIIDNRKLSLRQRSGNHRWKGRKLMEAGPGKSAREALLMLVGMTQNLAVRIVHGWKSCCQVSGCMRIPIAVAIPNPGLVLSDQKHSFITKVTLKDQALATRQAYQCRDSIGVSGGAIDHIQRCIFFSLNRKRCHADCDR